MAIELVIPASAPRAKLLVDLDDRVKVVARQVARLCLLEDDHTIMGIWTLQVHSEDGELPRWIEDFDLTVLEAEIQHMDVVTPHLVVPGLVLARGAVNVSE